MACNDKNLWGTKDATMHLMFLARPEVNYYFGSVKQENDFEKGEFRGADIQ